MVYFVIFDRCIVWNAKAEKIQDVTKSHQNDYFKPRNYFSNQENNISYTRRIYITTTTFICVQGVLNTCVKMKIFMQE